MASARLLTHVLALCALACVLAGCAFGPIWARTIEGQVTDAETGQPVVGAEVFASYKSSSLLDPTHHNYAFRWATTDDEGRFSIPGRPAPNLWAFGWVSRWNPDVAVLDRRYGISFREFSMGGPPPDWRHMEIKICREPNEIERLNSAKTLSEVCGLGVLDCFRACQLWYGEQQCSRVRKASGR